MGNHEIKVIHPTGGWEVVHHADCCGGPLRLSVDGQLVVSGFDTSFDGIGSEAMTVKKARVYHKSGVAVFEGEGVFPSGPETGVWTACRYAGNIARITTDLSIKKETAVKQGIQCGSMTLHGKWVSLTTVPDFAKTALSEGQVIHYDELLLAWVFEREDGFKLEIDTGFDLWRWKNSVEPGHAVADVEIFADHVDFKRHLLVVTNDSEEGIQPTPRDYRFYSQLAWSTPALYADVTNMPELTHLEVLPKGKGVDVKALGEKPAVSIDFSELTALDSMHVTHDDKLVKELCWECNNTKLAAKRIIRQLAAKSAEGFLQIENGMTPSVCDNGKHVDRPGKTVPHWDLNGITSFAVWARQCLGDGWQVVVKQPEPWAGLPSLRGLFAPNGFSKADLSVDEENTK
ncbi:MAG: hypothetical protein IKP58_03180 [Victivallales bacterium]|nr:hypothetical protein [Victivallales bacterium]